MRNLSRKTWKPAANRLQFHWNRETTVALRSAPAPMSDWTYRLAALAAALLLLATAGGAL